MHPGGAEDREQSQASLALRSGVSPRLLWTSKVWAGLYSGSPSTFIL